MPNQLSTIGGDLTVRGQINCQSINLPGTCVGNAQVDPTNPIQALNLQHQYQPAYSQPNGVATVADRRAVFGGYGVSGVVVGVSAGLVTPCVGPDTISVDIRLNGVSILSTPISLTSALAAYAQVAGAVVTGNYTAGQVFEILVTPNHSTGTLGQGVFVNLVLRESAV